MLIEIQTVANTAGIAQAQAGMLGLGASTIALAALLAGGVIIGKSAVDNYKAQETAANELSQAYATQKDTLEKHRLEIAAFLDTNKRYIADQYDTEAALAATIRAGNNETQAMRILNDALDLSALKHTSVSEAAQMLVMAEAGNSRGLRFLGITTVEYNAIMKSKLSVQEKDAALLALIETKTKDGRKTTDDLSQSQRALNKDWQDFTARIGPGVTTVLNDIFQIADWGVGRLEALDSWLVAIGNDAKAWGGIQNFLVSAGNVATGGATHIHRAGGGSVNPYGAYTVGESGPETLVMGSQGGNIIPNGGGNSQVHIHIEGGIFLDNGPSIDRLSMVIAQRLGYTTGR